METDIHFNTTFLKYVNTKDKFDSLYIFVLYKLNLEDSHEKISRMIAVIDSMNDPKKKTYLKNRLHNFREYLKTNYKPESIINGIFMVSDNIDCESLIPYYAQTLDMFSHNKMSHQYGPEYPLEWLKNLLLDREYINVLKVKNNDITHTKMNSTKKISVYTNTIKSMDLSKIVLDRIPKGEPYLIHGVSVSLKNYSDKNAVSISTSELTDELILKIMSNIKNIQLCIKAGLLKILFCTETIHKKMSNIPEHFKNFEIKVITSMEKGDIADRLENDYGGAIGIKYY